MSRKLSSLVTASGSINNDEDTPEVDIDIESGSGEHLQDFFTQVSHCKDQVKAMQRYIEDIKRLQQAQLWNADSEGSDGRLHSLLSSCNGTANDIRDRLKKMHAENRNLSEDDPNARARKSQLAALVHSFQNIMTEYQQVQETYRDNYKERVRRQSRIVNPNISEAEVESMFQPGHTPQQTFATALEVTAAQNALVYIQEQHRDIQELESSIVELHQLFVDMAVLTQAQGEMLHSIDQNVAASVAATSESYRQLVRAEAHANAYRKRCCCIIIIVLIVLAILAAAIGGGVAAAVVFA